MFTKSNRSAIQQAARYENYSALIENTNYFKMIFHDRLNPYRRAGILSMTIAILESKFPLREYREYIESYKKFLNEKAEDKGLDEDLRKYIKWCNKIINARGLDCINNAYLYLHEKAKLESEGDQDLFSSFIDHGAADAFGLAKKKEKWNIWLQNIRLHERRVLLPSFYPDVIPKSRYKGFKQAILFNIIVFLTNNMTKMSAFDKDTIGKALVYLAEPSQDNTIDSLINKLAKLPGIDSLLKLAINPKIQLICFNLTINTEDVLQLLSEISFVVSQPDEKLTIALKEILDDKNYQHKMYYGYRQGFYLHVINYLLHKSNEACEDIHSAYVKLVLDEIQNATTLDDLEACKAKFGKQRNFSQDIHFANAIEMASTFNEYPFLLTALRFVKFSPSEVDSIVKGSLQAMARFESKLFNPEVKASDLPSKKATLELSPYRMRCKKS